MKVKLLHIGIFDTKEPQQSLRDALAGISSVYIEYNYQDHLSLINELILSVVEQNNIEIVFMQIQRANVIRVETVKQLKEKGVVVLNFTGDVRQPIPKWYVDLAPYVVSLFTNATDSDYVSSLGYEANYFQIGYNNNYYNTTGGAIGGGAKIVFMGNNYKGMFPLSGLRENVVKRLTSKHGCDFAVYGTGWQNTIDLNFRQEEEATVYRSALIAINLSHFNLKRYSSDRLFRILGCGTLCLSHNYQEIEKEFTDGKHLRLWNNLEELESLVNYYLDEKNSEERKVISVQGNMICEEKYTWKYRIENQLISIYDRHKRNTSILGKIG